jgi:ADP-heptose:LPS heptosyltransferase
MQLKPAKLQIDRPIRILVDRRKAVGDVIMITPVLRELRKRYGPDAFIQVVTEETIVLENNTDINAVCAPANMKKEDPWDMYFNLNDAYETNIKSHYVDAYLYRAFGNDIENIDKQLCLTSNDEEIAAVDEAIASIGSDYVVFHMRRWAWENKNMDPEMWTMIMAWLEGSHPDIKIVTVGAHYDMRAPAAVSNRYIDLVEQLSIGEIKHLIANAKAFVGGDSGPYHIACTTNTPIVALLSHLDPEQILPWRDGEFGKGVQVVKSRVPCTGCYSRQIAPVRNLVCEQPKDKEWLCNRSFDFQEITNALTQAINSKTKHDEITSN